jgi:hypothetical protein
MCGGRRRAATLQRVPSLFRRKSASLVEDPVTEVTPGEDSVTRPRGYTPGKGRVTPKRPAAGRRPGGAAVPATKEEARQRRRELRAQQAEEFRREGGPRDRGPERALARDVVDSRRTVGSMFFGGAMLVLVGSMQGMPPVVRLASDVLWVALAVALVVDSVLISRRIRKLVRQRFPKSTERLGSLYFYAIMRSISFRRMRAPVPRVDVGDPI